MQQVCSPSYFQGSCASCQQGLEDESLNHLPQAFHSESKGSSLSPLQHWVKGLRKHMRGMWTNRLTFIFFSTFTVSFKYIVKEGDPNSSQEWIYERLKCVFAHNRNVAFARFLLQITCLPTILVEDCVGGRWSGGVSLHHPFEAGLLSSCILHPSHFSHHGTELHCGQVTTRGKS